MVDAHTNDARNNMELLRNVYGSQIHIFDNYIPFSVRMKESVRERNRVWFGQMGNRRGYQALYVGRSMDEHSTDSNRSTDDGEQTEAAEVCKK